MAECVCLLPSHTNYRVFSITWHTEISCQQRIIVRILKVTSPNHRIRINTNNRVCHNIGWLTQCTSNSFGENLLILYPEGIHLHSRILTITTQRHIKTVHMLLCLCHVFPTIAIFQFCSTQITSSIIVVQWRKCLCHRIIHQESFLIWNLLFPIDTRIILFILIWACQCKFTLSTIYFYQQRICNRVTNPVHELLILIIGNLGIIHPKGIYRHHHIVIWLIKQCRLRVCSHHKRTLLHEDHSIRHCLLKFFTFASTYQLTCGWVTCHHSQGEYSN